MSKHEIQSASAPSAIGPYSQAILRNGTLWMSGQIALDPSTMQIVDGGIEAQAARVFDNMAAVLAAAGGGFDDVVKLTILLVDLGDFAQVNEIMAARFSAPYPARSTYQVAALPRGSRLEVEAVAVLAPSGVSEAQQTGWRDAFDANKAA
ncbi:MAG TPA: Rid family detoxifying hydrolase [Gemmatimonadaceae bacterium]|jgi:reactive intermediate/imine deaminase|nr:Rid family detoxifying hydrolase [Gemmatimonadaceae bacterium]